jgi:hypothetical protein
LLAFIANKDFAQITISVRGFSMTKGYAAFQKAFSDPARARSMLDRPVTTLGQLGLNIPHTSDEEFARRLAVEPGVHDALRAVASGQKPEGIALSNCFKVALALEGVAAALLAAGGVVFVAESPLVVTVTALLGAFGPAVSAEVVADWVTAALANANYKTAKGVALAIAMEGGFCP